jgi:ribosomal protein L32E
MRAARATRYCAFGFSLMHTASRSRTAHASCISFSTMYDSRLRSTCSATWRSANSRNAIKLPRRKKFFSACSTFSLPYTSPRRIRFCSASGVKSTITVSSDTCSTQSGTVSRTTTPVIARTVGAILSMC